MAKILPNYGCVFNAVDVSSALEDLVWEHSPDSLAARCIATVGLHPTIDTAILGSIAEGANVVATMDGSAEFDGTLVDIDFTETGKAQLVLTAYDRAWYLPGNEEDVQFTAAQTGEQRIRLLGANFGIPFGQIDLPGVALPQTTYRSKDLAFIVQDVIRKVQLLSGGDEYVVVARGGAIDIIRTGGNSSFRVFTPQNSILMNEKRSIADLVTQVKVVGVARLEESPDPNRTPSPLRPQVLQGYTQFGVRQKLVHTNQAQDAGAAADEAASILASQGAPYRLQVVEGPDFPGLRKGDLQDFRVGTLNGVHMVSGHHHSAVKGTCRMWVDTRGRRERLGKISREKGTAIPELPEGATTGVVPGVR